MIIRKFPRYGFLTLLPSPLVKFVYLELRRRTSRGPMDGLPMSAKYLGAWIVRTTLTPWVWALWSQIRVGLDAKCLGPFGSKTKGALGPMDSRACLNLTYPCLRIVTHVCLALWRALLIMGHLCLT